MMTTVSIVNVTSYTGLELLRLLAQHPQFVVTSVTARSAAGKRLAEVFAEERSKLEQQWDRGDNVSTEDLRIALQRYRSFFHRLLSI